MASGEPKASRVGGWDIDRWAEFLTAGRAPKTRLSSLAGRTIHWDFFDLSAFDWLQNSIAERCELAVGTVLTAAHLGLIGTRRPLFVIGRGPSAFFASLAALSRGFRVVFVTKNDNTRFLTPLIGSKNRFVS